MKVLTLFYVEFYEWPLAILRAIETVVGDVEVCAVVVRDGTVVDRLGQERGLNISSIDRIADHEREWLEAPLDDGGQADPALVERILCADRHVGVNRVTGGLIPETPLSRACRNDARGQAVTRRIIQHADALIDRHKPDLVLCYLPEDGISLAMAQAARRREIAFVTFASSRFADRFGFFLDEAGAIPSFTSQYARARAAGADSERHRRGAVLLDRFRATPSVPGYMAYNIAATYRLPPLRDLASLAWRVLRRRPPEVPSYPYPEARLAWELRRWWGARHALRGRITWDAPPVAGPWVFYPLQVDPEAGSIIAAPHCTDQIAVVAAIAKAVPPGWGVVVKEHVPMLGRRPAGYYDRLRAIPGVRLVSPQISGRAMIEAAAATVVVTGTAGIEATLMGRPAVFLGPTPLSATVPGCHVAEGLADLPRVLAAALAGPPPVDEDLALYLALVEEFSLPLETEEFFGGLRSVTPDVVARHGQALGGLVGHLFADGILDSAPVATEFVQ